MSYLRPDLVQTFDYFAQQEEGNAEGRTLNVFRAQCALVATTGIKWKKRYIYEFMEKSFPDWDRRTIYLSMFESLVSAAGAAVDDEIIFQAYNLFDIQKNGYISLNDFKKVIRKVCPHLTDSRVDAMFHDADIYNMQKVTFQHFVQMMKFNRKENLPSIMS